MRLFRPARHSARLRLTALYGGGVIATGAAALTVMYVVLTRRAARKVHSVMVFPKSALSAGGKPVPGKPNPDQVAAAQHLATQVRHDMLRDLLAVSAIAMAAVVVVALLLGWWMAGRVLRPVHVITTTARRLSSENLHQRIELRGPDDEFKRLADTFDEMLGRLADAFDSQRRFVANASHELRTPLALQRTALEIGLIDDAPPPTVARVRGELLGLNRRCERLVSGLLLLAQSERGLEERHPVRLDEVAGAAVRQYERAAREAGVRLVTSLRAVGAEGDGLLLEQLVGNLVSNAIRYNRPGGMVEAETGPGSRLMVRNTGPEVPAEQVNGLFEPFRRLGPRDTERPGLGLSIVRSITRAHGGTVRAAPNPGGGLEIEVCLPPPAR